MWPAAEALASADAATIIHEDHEAVKEIADFT
jgi:hypothetical protein